MKTEFFPIDFDYLDIDSQTYIQIFGRDKQGIVASISTLLFNLNINIEDIKVKTIIVDVGVDLDTIQQCIGRKRIKSKEDKINLYILYTCNGTT